MKIFSILFGVSLLLSGQASAEEYQQIAVLSIDLPTSPNAEKSVLKTLRNAEIEVISSEEIQERLKQSQSPIPDEELAREFAKMSTTVSKGVEKFFYENERKAIKILQPIYNKGMNNLNVLARRPDYADQIFQAGILLIRSYESKGEKEDARAVINLIVRNFPTKSFSASVIPPKVIKALEKARRNLTKEKTSFRLLNRGTKSSQCTAFVNGFVAPLNTEIIVKGNTVFHLYLDCGIEKPVVWNIRIKKGDMVDIPITPTNPMLIGFASDDISARQNAETSLKTVMFWAHLDHIVGVSEHYQGEDGLVLVVRIQKDHSPKWSDGSSEEDVYKALVRVFPEMNLERSENSDYDEGKESSTATSSTDWFGWTLIGTGLLGAAGNTAFLLLPAIDRQNEITKINENSNGDYFRSSLGKQHVSEVDTQIALSYGLYAVSAGITGYGLYRVLTHTADTKENTFQFTPSLSKQAVGFQLRTSF